MTIPRCFSGSGMPVGLCSCRYRKRGSEMRLHVGIPTRPAVAQEQTGTKWCYRAKRSVEENRNVFVYRNQQVLCGGWFSVYTRATPIPFTLGWTRLVLVVTEVMMVSFTGD